MKKKERFSGRWWWAAAAVALLLGFGALLAYYAGTPVLEPPPEPLPVPGGREPRQRAELEPAVNRILQRLRVLGEIEILGQDWILMRAGGSQWYQWRLQGKSADLEKAHRVLQGVKERLLEDFGLSLLLFAEPERGLLAFVMLDAGEVVGVGNLVAGRPVVRLSRRPQIAVVIDDFGFDSASAAAFAALPLPLTGAVLPGLSHSAEVARLLKERGCEVLLHLPMEPRGYPEVKPGPGALFVDMPPARLAALTRENLAGLPEVIGVNNHMGSRFTAAAGPMRAVLEVLAERGLFFLDSRTHAGSTAYTQALALGLPALQRDVFLDNIRDVEHIVVQLKVLLEVAAAKGRAVAIGHPYPQTLTALSQLPRMAASAGVEIVSLSTMLPDVGRGAGLQHIPQ